MPSVTIEYCSINNIAELQIYSDSLLREKTEMVKKLKKNLVPALISLLLLLLTMSTASLAPNTKTMSATHQLESYLQGYTPNKIILYDLLDHADEAEWYAQPREEQIPFGEDLGDEGAVRYEYNVTLEDGKTYDRTVMVRPNINLTPQNWSDIEGRWYFELPNVTPLYLKAEWGFAPEDHPIEKRIETEIHPVSSSRIFTGQNLSPCRRLALRRHGYPILRQGILHLACGTSFQGTRCYFYRTRLSRHGMGESHERRVRIEIP